MDFAGLKNLKSCLIDGNKIEELDSIFSLEIKSGRKFLSKAPEVSTSWNEINEYVIPTDEFFSFDEDIHDYQELVEVVRYAAFLIAPQLEKQFLSGSGSCHPFTSMLKASTERELCVEKIDANPLKCVQRLMEVSGSVNGTVDFLVMSSDTLKKTEFSMPGIKVFTNEHAGNSVYAGLWLDNAYDGNGVCVTSPSIREFNMNYSRSKYFLQHRVLGLSADSGAAYSRKEGGVGLSLRIRANLGFFVKGTGVFRMDGF